MADGPDGEPFTRDDVVLSATAVRADPAEAARLKDKPLTWREKRLIELKGEEGRREVEAARGEAPETRIDGETTIGGLVTLEGAAYYWFWTGCMLAAAVAFVPIALFYRGRPHLQDELGAGLTQIRVPAHRAPAQPGSGGNSVRIGSVVSGIRLPASSSPAAQPAISPTVSAIARTRGKTWAFSGGNWLW